ncbi:MAG: hypothetical protein HY040_23540 [Planctomycetes bacterium]|nr:hypothetical protein [Planctomycetota bacterium]
MESPKKNTVNDDPVHLDEVANRQVDTEPAPAMPKIESEPADTIKVGAGGKLVVPREDLDADLDDGAEIDLVNLQAKKIRKPGRREWVVFKLGLELPTRMLLYKPRPDAIETDYYYVEKALRGPIRDEPGTRASRSSSESRLSSSLRTPSA